MFLYDGGLICLLKMIGVALLVIGILIVGIYVMVELKRMRHKLFAFALIALILFMYVSMLIVFKGKNIEYTTVPGLIKATNLYFSWIVGVVGNVGSITSNAVKMDWTSQNETVGG